MDIKIGFIGGGNMATSLIGGLVDGDHATSDIIIYEPNSDKAKQLARQFQVTIASDNTALIQQSDVIVMAVKPQVLQQVLSPLAESFNTHKPLIISVVAGIQISSIENWLNGQYAIVRVMPNTPALIGQGASALVANERVNQGQRSIAASLLASVGITVWLDNEMDIDNVTALSGSGPAYFMLFIKCLIDAAVNSGMEENTAKNLAIQTAIGAAQLVAQSEDSLETLINNVTSPNGTTEAALNAFAQANLPNVINHAFNAAKRRSQELADELG